MTIPVVLVSLLFFGFLVCLAIRPKKKEEPKPEPVPEPIIDKVCIWWKGDSHADVYEDVAVAHLFKKRLLRIIYNNGDKVYINLDRKDLLRFNVYYKEPAIELTVTPEPMEPFRIEE